MNSFHSVLFRNFNDSDITAYQFVKHWNSLTEYYDTVERQKEDDLYFVRFQVPDRTDDVKANPDKITMNVLFESAAHCREMSILATLPVQNNVFNNVFTGAHTGHYCLLVELLNGCVTDNLLFSVIPRIVGIAFQTPFITSHLQPQQVFQPRIEDGLPTWRAHRIINGLKQKVFTAELILEDRGPDVVCDYFGWPHVSTVISTYLNKSHFRGIHDGLSFINNDHASFCQHALTASPRLVWLDDIYTNVDNSVNTLGKQFQPPFSLFGAGQVKGGELIIQRDNCASLVLPLLTTFACQDLLFNRDLTTTNRWVKYFSNKETSIQKWSKYFKDSYGLNWEGMV
jgi:hypothetical protein